MLRSCLELWFLFASVFLPVFRVIVFILNSFCHGWKWPNVVLIHFLFQKLRPDSIPQRLFSHRINRIVPLQHFFIESLLSLVSFRDLVSFKFYNFRVDRHPSLQVGLSQRRNQPPPIRPEWLLGLTEDTVAPVISSWFFLLKSIAALGDGVSVNVVEVFLRFILLHREAWCWLLSSSHGDLFANLTTHHCLLVTAKEFVWLTLNVKAIMNYLGALALQKSFFF